MKKRFDSGEHHILLVDYIPFLDEIAQLINAKPNLLKYFFTYPKLWSALLFGPSLPYQYRLEGPHSWPKAREPILMVFDRIEAHFKTKNLKSCSIKFKNKMLIYENYSYEKVFLSIIMLCSLIFIILNVYF